MLCNVNIVYLDLFITWTNNRWNILCHHLFVFFNFIWLSVFVYLDFLLESMTVIWLTSNNQWLTYDLILTSPLLSNKASNKRWYWKMTNKSTRNVHWKGMKNAYLFWNDSETCPNSGIYITTNVSIVNKIFVSKLMSSMFDPDFGPVSFFFHFFILVHF